MKILITLTSVLFLLAVSSTALAGMRPSFDPEGCKSSFVPAYATYRTITYY